MNGTDDTERTLVGETGEDLAFFSKICASISHEIKNCLAVISEQNGLHQDLLMLQSQGRPPAPERIEKIARTIDEQVHRMDRIIKRLNRFAHTPDTACARIDLAEICGYTVDLCRRFAVNRGVTLLSEGEPGIAVQGQAFLLLHFLVECIENIFDRSSSGDTVRLTVSQGKVGPVIAITPPLEHTSESVQSMAGTMGLTFGRTEEEDASLVFFSGV